MTRPPLPSVPVLVVAALTSVAVLSACIEDPLALDADQAPGASSETRDVTLLASELPGWRDTTYSGFVLASQSPFRLVANTADLSARILAALDVPDTVRTFADTLPAQSYDSVRVRIAIDTVDSRFTTFPVTVRMVSLTRGFEQDSANWSQARPGEPWTTPGGDLGVQLASSEMAAVADSIVFTLDVDEDSLFKAWRADDGEPGFAIVVEGPETHLNVRSITFRYEALLEGREVPVNLTNAPTSGTFIHDPPQPPTGLALRIGGLPANRFYLELDIPDELQGIPLLNAVINHAELLFEPLEPPDAPFPLEDVLASRQVKLLADPFVFYEKTPIGTAPLSTVPLAADTLAAGRPARYDVTLLVLNAVRTGESKLRIGIRGDPDGQTFGFWEFGSVESPVDVQPKLRIVFTPPPEFEVPG